jgi:hypothetical protein
LAIFVAIIFILQNLILMKNYFLLLLVIHCCQISCAQNHTLSKCKLEGWKGRKANYKVEKIIAYTGKDFKNPAVEYYDGYSEKRKIWKKRYDGIYCMFDTIISDSSYRVKDTFACREFKIIYHVFNPKILVKGKLKKVDGICEDKITPNLIAGLNQKLLDEKILDELPDISIPNWPHVYYLAIRQYQEKYGLHVGLLTLETARHMKLSF